MWYVGSTIIYFCLSISLKLTMTRLLPVCRAVMNSEKLKQRRGSITSHMYRHVCAKLRKPHRVRAPNCLCIHTLLWGPFNTRFNWKPNERLILLLTILDGWPDHFNYSISTQVYTLYYQCEHHELNDSVYLGVSDQG